MKKHPLVRAIQYLEKHYGPVDVEAGHDSIYLVIKNKFIISKHRLKRLQLLNIQLEEVDIDYIEEDFVEDIVYFIYYT